MPDRGKIIERLNFLTAYGAFSEEWKQVLRGAVELLNGQTAQWIWDRPHHFRCSGCNGVVGQKTYLYCPNCGREMLLSETERRKEWPEEVSGDAL